MSTRQGGAKTAPPKMRILSPAAQRALLESKAARERVQVLRELRHFGRALCATCSHEKEQHVEEDGREVCLVCWDSRLRPHGFVTLLTEARRYFASRTDVDGGERLDTAGSPVLYYRDRPQTPRGEDTMAVSTKRKRPVATDETEAPARTRRAAPPRTAPPAPARRTAAPPASKRASTGDLNECMCGCGGETKSRFRPGHDATLKSRLINQALEGATAKERATAEKRIATLGWTEMLEKSAASRAAKAERASERPARASGRTAAQKAATERMRSANQRKAAKDEEFDDEVEDDEDEDLEDDEEEDDDE